MKKVKFLAAVLGAALFVACKDDQPNLPAYQAYALAAGSTAKWKGTVVNGPSNEGTIAVSGQGFHIADGRLIGGEVKISVASIAVTNFLPDAERTILMHHLRSSDFFDLALYPFATYTMVSAEQLAATDQAGNNYTIYGSMSLLGNTRLLQLPAKITFAGNKLMVKSTFKFDRTKWGMSYAADAPIPNLGMIEKDVEVTLDLVAEK